jgi:transposase
LIQLTPHMRILVATEPADFRKGIDGIARLCRETLGADPFSGTVYVFRNRRATSIKLLVYDTQGFWLFQKRLSKGKFRCWPSRGENGVSALAAHELTVLLFGGDPAAARAVPTWRRVVARAL